MCAKTAVRVFVGFSVTIWLVLAAPLFAKTVTLGSADNKTAICLVEGDTLVITLPSPIVPSYRWQAHPAKPSPLTALHDEYDAATGGKGEGSQTFRFNAASTGNIALELNFEKQEPGPAPQRTQTFSVDVTVASGEPARRVLLGVYQGTTACADCTGIATTLRLYSRGENDFTDTIYVMTRTYQGGCLGDRRFTDRGEWALLKGDAVDPNATVYALSPEQPDQTQYFLVQSGGSSLIGLDKQMRPITAPPMYQTMLKRLTR
jgi:predicted secreted protein